MKCLYLFNPENDMALASGSPYYMPPASAKKMAMDLASLPVWYADEGSEVLVSDAAYARWMQEECRFHLKVGWTYELFASGYDKICPWGWNPALLRKLVECGASESVIPADMQMHFLRNLSSRKTAVELLPRLMMPGMIGESFWLVSVDEVVAFASRHDKVLLKSPWSGSGKGIQPLCGVPDENLKGWVRRIIATQGGVVGEPFYNKVLDFAMEFRMSSGVLSFVGYSLFEADCRGIYKGNRLATDADIEKQLSLYISLDVLHELQKRLAEELPEFANTSYQGYLGVDMMVVRTENGYAVHPCVEVNWRMNMGIVSRLFYDNYVSPQSQGRYVIEYYATSKEVLAFHERMKSEYPLVVEDGRIKEGYLSLTPVLEDTSYQIYVVIENAWTI